MGNSAILINLNTDGDHITNVTWLELENSDPSWVIRCGHSYKVRRNSNEAGINATLGTILFALHPYIEGINTKAIVMNAEQRDRLMDELDRERLLVPPLFVAEDVFESHIIDQIMMELGEYTCPEKAA